mmetsp:Transcript_31992/g.90809  ORF Transcript_31992/g.90809 Transcript_31992/m.90809 type:complete len:245 (-) Transcript_31992:92-826(-)
MTAVHGPKCQRPSMHRCLVLSLKCLLPCAPHSPLILALSSSSTRLLRHFVNLPLCPFFLFKPSPSVSSRDASSMPEAQGKVQEKTGRISEPNSPPLSLVESSKSSVGPGNSIDCCPSLVAAKLTVQAQSQDSQSPQLLPQTYRGSASPSRRLTSQRSHAPTSSAVGLLSRRNSSSMEVTSCFLELQPGRTSGERDVEVARTRSRSYSRVWFRPACWAVSFFTANITSWRSDLEVAPKRSFHVTT